MTNDKTGVFTTNAHEAFSLLGECYIIRSCLDNYYHAFNEEIKKIHPIGDKSWKLDESNWSISEEEINGIWQCISSEGHVFEYKSQTIEERREKIKKKIETKDRWFLERLKHLTKNVTQRCEIW